MMDLDEEYYMYKTDKSDDIQYEFLSSEDLKTEMTTIIENVKAMLQYPSGICRILLQQHKWSNQLLLDKFYENPDPNDFLAKCGLLPEGSVIVSEEQECPICCISGKLFGLACNHMACDDCWSAYIDGKMKAKRSEIECMQLDCKLLMVDEKVTEFIKDASIYEDVIINSYVKTHKTLRWCPETCRTAVRVKTPVHSLISCPCGVNYCFTCGNEGHEPINCRLLRKWLRRCQDDNSSYKWLNANTKDCPTCQTPIEKTGGCNHMTCQKCKKHFCWLCLTPWNLRHDCSRYRGLTVRQGREALEKYFFYFNRFVAHQKSSQLEKKLKPVIQNQMSQLRAMSLSNFQVEYLQNAYEALSNSRRTLMYSFAFAYYLKRDNNVMIFEDNLKDLEQATEQLSGMLEKKMLLNDLLQMKQPVQEKCQYVEKRRQVLLKHCSEGDAQDIWVFNQ